MDKHKDEQFWKEQDRRLFPDKKFIDFGSASIGVPMSLETELTSTVQKGAECSKKEIEHARGLAAELLNTSPDHIYFDTNTINGITRVLEFLDPERREILTTAAEITDVARVLINHAKKVSSVETTNIIKNMKRKVTPHIKAIVVSYVTHATCNLLPVKEISDIARKYKVPFIIDAAQAFGHIPVNAEEIGADFIVGSGHKWLRGRVDGRLGTAIVYAKNAKLQDKYSLPGQWVDDEYVEPPNGHNMDNIAHLGRCLEEYKSLGWNDIYARIQYLGEIAQTELSKTRIEMLHSSAPGTIPFRTRETEKLCERLDEKSIRVTYKPAEDIIRVSISPFNTIEEIQHLKNNLEKITQ